jgi:hypothetical protein
VCFLDFARKREFFSKRLLHHILCNRRRAVRSTAELKAAFR